MDAVNVEPSPVQGRQVVDVSFLLAHASHVLATRITAAFAEIGITPREYCVLAHAMSGQYTQIELATIADLDKTTMLNSMDYLEREGYAERTPSPTDRRARIIVVTPAGAGLVAQGHQIADRVHGEVLDALPADQRDVLTSALGTLVTGVLADPVTSERPVRRPRAGNRPLKDCLHLDNLLFSLHGTRPPRARARHLVRGNAHDHPRRHDRDRRAPHDPG
jgi:MarR family transcriptional regulator, transcriptional regulator for hemolysin